jgi:GAF domain-containing protein
MINEDIAGESARLGIEVRIVGDAPKSVLFVPLSTGGRATGFDLAPERRPRARLHRADQRLLSTLAGSLSVALENARLVHETRQRNAELALINSVQAAIAGELDPQAIYDLVGDKIQEVFDAQVVDHVDRDESDRTDGRSRTRSSAGSGSEWPSRCPRVHGIVLETREPLMIIEDVPGEAARSASRSW